MKKAFLIFGLMSVTTSAFAARQSVVAGYWCSERDTRFNPFKLSATRSCAKDGAARDAKGRCSLAAGYIANIEVDVSCEFARNDDYYCEAVANVTCDLIFNDEASVEASVATFLNN